MIDSLCLILVLTVTVPLPFPVALRSFTLVSCLATVFSLVFLAIFAPLSSLGRCLSNDSPVFTWPGGEMFFLLCFPSFCLGDKFEGLKSPFPLCTFFVCYFWGRCSFSVGFLLFFGGLGKVFGSYCVFSKVWFRFWQPSQAPPKEGLWSHPVHNIGCLQQRGKGDQGAFVNKNLGVGVTERVATKP